MIEQVQKKQTVISRELDPRANSASEWPVLSALRFWLASIVVVGHVASETTAPHWLSSYTQFGGWAAVIGFLIISGYSINHSISRESHQYLLRRVLRIYPSYIFSLLFGLALFAIFGHAIVMRDHTETAPNPLQVVGNALLLQGLCTPKIHVLAPAWTLAIEFWFYLLAPILVKQSTRLLLVPVFLSALFYVKHKAFGFNGNMLTAQYGIGALMFGWTWIGGFVYYRLKTDARVRLALCIIPGLMLCAYYPDRQTFALFTICAAASIIAMSREFALPSSIQRIANYLGDLSYPLYIVHYPVIVFIIATHKKVSSLLMLLAILVVSAIVLHAIDRPFRKLGKRMLNVNTKKIVLE